MQISQAIHLDPVQWLVQHEVDPTQFRFSFDGVYVFVQYRQARVGFLEVAPELGENDGTYFVVRKVQLQPDFRGKGIGSVLYLVAAKELYDRTGEILYKSEIVSPDAERVWERLTATGLAEEWVGNLGTYSRFRSDVLSEPFQNLWRLVIPRP